MRLTQRLYSLTVRQAKLAVFATRDGPGVSSTGFRWTRRLRQLDPRAAADLERQLTKAFAMSRVGNVAERALPPRAGF
jgi:hypothetical protein